MKNTIFTNHAKHRCQNRGIPPKVVKFIIDHGKSLNTHGDKKYFIPKKMLNSLKYDHKDFLRSYDKFIKNTAVVCNGDVVITAMKITKRI